MAGEAVISSTSPACRCVLHTPVDRRGAIWWGPWNFAASFPGGVLEMSLPDSSSGNKQTSCLVAAGIGCLAIILVGGLAIVGFGYAGYRGFHSIEKSIGTDARKEAAIMVLESIPLVKIVKEDDAAHQVTDQRTEFGRRRRRFRLKMRWPENSRITDAKRVQAMVNTQERVELSGPEGQKIVLGSVADTAAPAWIPTYGERGSRWHQCAGGKREDRQRGLYDAHGGFAGGCEELFRQGFHRRKLQSVEFMVQIWRLGAGRHAGDRGTEEDQGRGDFGGEWENDRVDQLRGTEAVGTASDAAFSQNPSLSLLRCFRGVVRAGAEFDRGPERAGEDVAARGDRGDVAAAIAADVTAGRSGAA